MNKTARGLYHKALARNVLLSGPCDASVVSLVEPLPRNSFPQKPGCWVLVWLESVLSLTGRSSSSLQLPAVSWWAPPSSDWGPLPSLQRGIRTVLWTVVFVSYRFFEGPELLFERFWIRCENIPRVSHPVFREWFAVEGRFRDVSVHVFYVERQRPRWVTFRSLISCMLR